MNLVLRRSSGVVLGLWAAVQPDDPLGDGGSMQACLERAGHRAPVPTVANNTCAQVGSAGTRGSVSQAVEGSWTYRYGGLVDLDVSPGDNGVRYANHVLGNHPGTGCVVLWFDR